MQECCPRPGCPGGEGCGEPAGWLLAVQGSWAGLGTVRNIKGIYVSGFVFCCLLVFAFYVEKLQAQQGDRAEE